MKNKTKNKRTKNKQTNKFIPPPAKYIFVLPTNKLYRPVTR